MELFLGLVEVAERGGDGKTVVIPTDDDDVNDNFGFSSSSYEVMMKVKEGKDKPSRKIGKYVVNVIELNKYISPMESMNADGCLSRC